MDSDGNGERARPAREFGRRARTFVSPFRPFGLGREDALDGVFGGDAKNHGPEARAPLPEAARQRGPTKSDELVDQVLQELLPAAFQLRLAVLEGAAHRPHN